ncbi:MAG TPA: hypothetical protein VI755_11550 [Anaerolineales bacterium]|nr:hypothetical protein [Anaerolineales bacterium]
MPQLYSVTSGLTAGAAAGSVKVAVALATGAQVRATITQIDVTLNGTNAASKPVKVELVKTTAAPSGGSTYTPLLNQPGGRTSQTTARINDTTDGSSPTIQQGYLVPATSGMVIQFPLGREIELAVSEFWEVRVTWQSAETVTDYLVNVWFTE